MKSRKIYLLILPILFMLSGLSSISAQCDYSSTSDAYKLYQKGEFDAVILSIKDCAFSSSNSIHIFDQESALVILALTYIAIDSLNEADKAVERLVKLYPLFQTRSDDPHYFQQLAKKHLLLLEKSKVASVSKVAEDMNEAPATIIQITAEEIKRRGYMDLEQLLHDLPGFDISRSNGITYSSIYMRGYRSDNSNRMLLLVDGVEENDLWGNVVYLSRQYPISRT